MKNYDAVIIGGSAAGVTAAVTTRRHYPDKSILLIRKERLVPIPCGIPYVLSTVGDANKNLIPVDNMLSSNNIDCIVGEVTGLDKDARVLATEGGEQISYGRLVIATGSSPLLPPIAGLDKKNVFTVRKDVPYLESILAGVEKSRDICVIGGGFIGVEIAEECRKKLPDARISIVEMQSHCLQLVYDEEFCIGAEKALSDQKIELVTGEMVDSIMGKEKAEGVRLKSGTEIKADLVIVGIGSTPNVYLAEKAGLAIGETKSIKVNQYMQTSDDNIFACGDCSEKVSFFDHKPSGLKLASIATMEARIAGANLFSLKRKNPGVIGVFSTVLGNTAFAAAGLTEAQAHSKGYDVVTGSAESVNRHPGCMPGGANIKVKLAFDAASRIILGGQAAGALSVGELINTISACIQQKMCADDIAVFQAGTHPALTASPIAYQLVNAAEMAVKNINVRLQL